MAKSKWPGTLPPIKNSTHALAEFRKLKSGWSQESVLNTRTLIYISQLLEQGRPKVKPKRKPSAWANFLGIGLKSGKTLQQISQEWKDKKVAGVERKQA